MLLSKKRLKLDDPNVRARAPSFHDTKDHFGDNAVSIWPFDPTFNIAER